MIMMARNLTLFDTITLTMTGVLNSGTHFVGCQLSPWCRCPRGGGPGPKAGWGSGWWWTSGVRVLCGVVHAALRAAPALAVWCAVYGLALRLRRILAAIEGAVK